MYCNIYTEPATFSTETNATVMMSSLIYYNYYFDVDLVTTLLKQKQN